MNWSTIESDPGVFTSLLTSFQTSGLEVTELWGIDPSSMPSHSYGLIFLFKWTGVEDPTPVINELQGEEADEEKPVMIPEGLLRDMAPELFFARQTVQVRGREIDR